MALRSTLREYAVYYYTLGCTALSRIFGDKWDLFLINTKYKHVFGCKPDLNDPKTFNEKMQWLKMHERDDRYTIFGDKIAVRDYWRKFGDEGLIPLLFQTDDWRQITAENMPDIPFIIKCNTGAAEFQIIRDKSKVDFKRLRKKCRHWMGGNYYCRSQEWQYKNVKPRILVEKLLLDKNGRIPNDYKLFFFNGKLEFVYCSIDREGENYRSIYSPEWERIDMEVVAKKRHKGGMVGANIPCPPTFPEMERIGSEIARDFSFVRVDFYDVDGKLYYGEITLQHGSGYCTFEPEKYDLIYGEKLAL